MSVFDQVLLRAAKDALDSVQAGLPPNWVLEVIIEAVTPLISAEARGPEGPYGWCATRDCHNPAITDIGFPICRSCDEANSYGAAWDTAHADALRAWGVEIDNGWIEKVEHKIRSERDAMWSKAVVNAVMGTEL